MVPITYDLAKERMADRLREAERHRLVVQAKAAAREEREASRSNVATRSRLIWWIRPRGEGTQVSNPSVSRSTL